MGIIKDIEKALENWPIWLSIIFLFVPGLMFKIQRSFPVLEFRGSLIIILLMISLYYSLPFLLLGLISRFIWNCEAKFTKEDLLYITSTGVFTYMIVNFLSNNRLSPIKIEFWAMFGILIFLTIIILFIKNKLWYIKLTK